MPKKTRREKLRASRRPVAMPSAPIPAPGPISTPSPQGIITTTANAATAAASRGRVAAPQLTFDYTYVYRDLRRILILAATFFILLIALSFVIK